MTPAMLRTCREFISWNPHRDLRKRSEWERMYILRIIMIALCAGVLMSGCSRKSSDPELRRLDKETNEAMASLTDNSTDSLGALLLDKAVEANSREYAGKAHFYLSKFYWGLDSNAIRQKMKHLDDAEEIAKEIKNDTLLAWVYNQRGVWEMAYNLAPVTARYWFNKSIETAMPLGKRWISIPAEMNMSESFRITEDTLGIQYDRDLFDYAVASKRPELMWASGLHCAMYYARTASDTARLQPYVSAIRNVDDPKYPQGVKELIYSIFYFNNGDYRKAAALIERAEPQRYKDFSVFYAEILNRLGRYAESDEWLDKVDSISGVLFADYDIKRFRLKAQNAAARHRWEDAYAWQRKYESLRDSMDASNTRDLSRRYKVEYEVNMKDRKIADQTRNLRELKMWTLCAVVFVTFVIAGLCIMIWRKRKFYRDIVRQNLDFVERQKVYDQRLAEYEANAASDGGRRQHPEGSAPRLNESRIDEIFDKIRILTEEKQVWRDVNITRDSFADMVGCNRTYFTEAIKERTGMSYTQYMNACRIREAIKVLSDTANDIPLKELSTQLGFITLANFYASFKKDTGISPAAFRKTAREIKTDRTEDD